MKVSVICGYNDKALLDTQLLPSLYIQNIKYEFVPVDNTKNKFSSASKALNYGASIATGDIFIFSHQDIYFKTPDELRQLTQCIQSCEDGSVIGTQGVRDGSKIYYTNLTSGIKLDENLVFDYEPKKYRVSCVDEGLFGMKRTTWDTHNFDEFLCDNWHLYCVEACLYARKQGYKVYVYPSQIHHFSRGIISLSYMVGLKRLCRIYRRDFKYIWTTCYKVRTNFLYINCLVWAWIFNRFLRRNLK